MPQQRLTMREIELGDGRAIARIMRRVTVLHSHVEVDLVSIIERLIASQRVIGVVVERGNGDGLPDMVGVTFSGFLAPEFAQAYRASPTPLLASQVFASAIAGRCLLLDLRGQAAGNLGDGLDLVVLEMAVDIPDPAPQAYRDVLNMVYSAYLELLRGFRIRSIMTEASEEFEPLIEGTGLRTVSRHSLEAGADHIVSPPGRSPHRCLFAITREELSSLPASTAAAVVMTYATPQLRLTPREQRFLVLALKGLTDNSLAGALGVSPNAVKQTWRRIYAHVLDAMPDLFRDLQGEDAGTRRGGEKRRTVLVHIRNNLQELRPHHQRRK